ncbi:hypothetical protein PQX77_017127 [Marasmius sp. AFHP31]|nr:hypothetical protein PQX77_017127 [Marasmius sp. AFHP31]
MIDRIEALRSGTMAAIRASNEETDGQRRGMPSLPGGNVGKGGQGHRGSVSRGKRMSASFKTSGSFYAVLTLCTWKLDLSRTFTPPAEPHKTVSHESFYKHIDTELPKSERLRQLLIWCHSRTAHNPSTFDSSDPSELPPVSTAADELFKEVCETSLQILADGQIDLNPYSSSSSKPDALRV